MSYELQINFIDERPETTTPVPESMINKVLSSAYSLHAESAAAVNLMIVNDTRISEINEEFLNHQGPTDVISFEDGDIEDGILQLGDIAVSADTAARIAATKGMSFDEELTLYALHGMLHLLGFDDIDDQDREKMIEAQQKEFLKHNLKYVI